MEARFRESNQVNIFIIQRYLSNILNNNNKQNLIKFKLTDAINWIMTQMENEKKRAPLIKNVNSNRKTK
jgi:hypothetical protein